MATEPPHQLEAVLSETTFPNVSELRSLLKRYNEHPEERAEVLAEIDKRFARRMAVLVLDTCGFSRAVRARGVVHFMALLERLEREVRPGIEKNGGRVLRREADNVYAVFDDPIAALAAAREILGDVASANEALPKDEEVEVSIGIGYGDLLVVGDDDVWGDEMNLASKLGEDIARCQEILLTPAAFEHLADAGEEFEENPVTISGVEIAARRLSRTEPSRDSATEEPEG